MSDGNEQRERAAAAGCLTLIAFLLWLALVGAGELVRQVLR